LLVVLFAIALATTAALTVSAEAPTEAKAVTATATATTSPGRLVYRAAKRYLGQPYTHTGYGVDCSELTQKAYRRALGISLYDSPASQMSRGRWVRNPRKGDLLFWDENGGSYPTHVGIAKGPGLWTLHASTYFGKVVVSDGSYIPGYLGAKRIY